MLWALAMAAASEPVLTVRPDLCVVTPQQPQCSVDFRLRWQVPGSGDYCVLASPEPERPLQCWVAARRGTHGESRVVTRSFDYLLERSGANGAPLVRTPVQVLPARSDDRRRNRRRRHVWSVL